MIVSRRSRFFALLFFALLASCATSSYQVIDQKGFLVEIQVTPDRILLECEDIKDHENAGDPKGNFGFMAHVVDEENTVITLIQEPVISRKRCFERLKEIDEIIKKGKSIYIGAHGSIEEPRVKEAQSYSFGRRGIFYGNGRSLQLSVIKNETGQCYSATSRADEPCMPPEFPIRKAKTTP